jgi:BMFP domain-containing protein YqiC
MLKIGTGWTHRRIMTTDELNKVYFEIFEELAPKITEFGADISKTIVEHLKDKVDVDNSVDLVFSPPFAFIRNMLLSALDTNLSLIIFAKAIEVYEEVKNDKKI